MIRTRSSFRRVAAAIATATVLSVSALPSGAASPQDIADERFAQMNGPLAAFVVTPDRFDIDARKVLADVPGLIDRVDGAQLRAWTTELAGMFRSSENSQAEIDLATDWVVGTFEGLGFTPEVLPVTHKGKSMPNITVTIPGTTCSDRILQVSAHYDAAGARNPGADDDATGMAGLFEIARILRDNPQPVTTRLVAFSFEEDGLVGSFAMADDDAAAGTDLVGAVSMDMLGYTDPDRTDPFVGMPSDYLAMAADPDSAELAKAFGAAVYTYTPEFPAAAAIIDPSIMSDIFRSDHAPFVLQGYQGLLVTDTGNFRNPHYHTPGDTLDTIDWDFVTGSTRAVLAGVSTYASSDQNEDGIADLCGDVAVPPTDEPGGGGNGPAGDDNEPAGDTNGAASSPAAARPVSAEPTYTG